MVITLSTGIAQALWIKSLLNISGHSQQRRLLSGQFLKISDNYIGSFTRQFIQCIFCLETKLKAAHTATASLWKDLKV